MPSVSTIQVPQDGRSRPPSSIACTYSSTANGLPLVRVIRQLMTRFPQVAIRSAASAGSRLFELQNRVGELSGERVEQRIARAVVRLVRQAGRRTDNGIEIDFPITRQELAEMAGSTLHTVSRTLSAWDDRGVTASSRRHIVVRKLHILLDMADQGAD